MAWRFFASLVILALIVAGVSLGSDVEITFEPERPLPGSALKVVVETSVSTIETAWLYVLGVRIPAEKVGRTKAVGVVPGNLVKPPEVVVKVLINSVAERGIRQVLSETASVKVGREKELRFSVISPEKMRVDVGKRVVFAVKIEGAGRSAVVRRVRVIVDGAPIRKVVLAKDVVVFPVRLDRAGKHRVKVLAITAGGRVYSSEYVVEAVGFELVKGALSVRGRVGANFEGGTGRATIEQKPIFAGKVFAKLSLADAIEADISYALNFRNGEMGRTALKGAEGSVWDILGLSWEVPGEIGLGLSVRVPVLISGKLSLGKVGANVGRYVGSLKGTGVRGRVGVLWDVAGAEVGLMKLREEEREESNRIGSYEEDACYLMAWLGPESLRAFAAVNAVEPYVYSATLEERTDAISVHTVLAGGRVSAKLAGLKVKGYAELAASLRGEVGAGSSTIVEDVAPEVIGGETLESAFARHFLPLFDLSSLLDVPNRVGAALYANLNVSLGVLAAYLTYEAGDRGFYSVYGANPSGMETAGVGITVNVEDHLFSVGYERTLVGDPAVFRRMLKRFGKENIENLVETLTGGGNIDVDVNRIVEDLLEGEATWEKSVSTISIGYSGPCRIGALAVSPVEVAFEREEDLGDAAGDLRIKAAFRAGMGTGLPVGSVRVGLYAKGLLEGEETPKVEEGRISLSFKVRPVGVRASAGYVEGKGCNAGLGISAALPWDVRASGGLKFKFGGIDGGSYLERVELKLQKGFNWETLGGLRLQGEVSYRPDKAWSWALGVLYNVSLDLR